MANNCYNFTKLSGPKKKIDKFFNACNVFKESRYRDVDMSVAVAHSVRPMPEELDLISEGWAHIDGIDAKYWWTIDKETDEKVNAEFDYDEIITYKKPLSHADFDNLIDKYGYYSWYKWQLANWGAKWGDRDSNLQRVNDKQIFWTYDSAWGPLINLDEFISKQFQLTVVNEWEEEAGKYGLYKFIDGIMVEHSTGIKEWDEEE